MFEFGGLLLDRHDMSFDPLYLIMTLDSTGHMELCEPQPLMNRFGEVGKTELIAFSLSKSSTVKRLLQKNQDAEAKIEALFGDFSQCA